MDESYPCFCQWGFENAAEKPVGHIFCLETPGGHILLGTGVHFHFFSFPYWSTCSLHLLSFVLWFSFKFIASYFVSFRFCFFFQFLAFSFHVPHLISCSPGNKGK